MLGVQINSSVHTNGTPEQLRSVMNNDLMMVALLVGSVAMGLLSLSVGVFLLRGGLARVSGWSALAEQYPVNESFQGEWHRRESGTVAMLTANATLNIGASDKYLYLCACLPLISFTPLQIPWSAITGPAVVKGNYVTLQIGAVQMRLRRALVPNTVLNRLGVTS